MCRPEHVSVPSEDLLSTLNSSYYQQNAGNRRYQVDGPDGEGFENIPGVHTVEVVVHAPPKKVRAVVGRYGSVEEIDEVSCRLRMTVDTLDWPAFALGSVGAEFEVLEPPDLVDHVREWAARFGRATA